MSEIMIYTTPFCPFCFRAKDLLDSKGIDFTEIDVMMNADLRQEMAKNAGSHTVPQIFVDDVHLGDCEEIFRLEAQGELDAKLGQ